MTMRPEYKPFVDDLIELCIREDIGDGDHTSLACIPADEHGRMRLLCKQEGVIAGIEIAQIVLRSRRPSTSSASKGSTPACSTRARPRPACACWTRWP